MSVAMGYVTAILGLLLLSYCLVELLWTVFLEGGAPLTSRVCYALATAVLWIHCRTHTKRLIAKAGLLAVVATVLIWVALLWAGWALLFCSSRWAVVEVQSGRPADIWARIYFAGYTIFTLGLGDYKPISHFWEIATALAAGSGFVLLGLALAYLVPVVQADTQKRQVAVVIWALGRDPADILIRAWNGVDTSALQPHLVSLIPMLAQLGENHLTYPVLHYFHSVKRASALAPNVAALDEALTILECGLQQGCSLDLPSLGAAREAITQFLDTLAPALIYPAKDSPPVPSLKILREAGVMVADEEVFGQSLVGLAQRRKLLLSLVRNEGWEWDAVWPAAFQNEASAVGR